MKLIIFLILFNFQSTVLSVDLCTHMNEKFGKGTCKKLKKDPNKEFVKYKKYCIHRGKPKHEAKFVKGELCNYGKMGCVLVPTEKLIVYCDENLVSNCYKNKKWLSRNQFFRLPPDFEIVNVSYKVHLKNGSKKEYLCAHYK